jgi:hypothetical protein
MSAEDKARLDAQWALWFLLLHVSGLHPANRVAATYYLGHAQIAGASGSATNVPIASIYIDPADYPAVGSLACKLRIKAVLSVNDVAPTGDYTFGLHPVTRPATSGGNNQNIFTVGAAVAGSTVAVSAPAADSQNSLVGADFAVPSAGFYAICVVTTATSAASSHVSTSAHLQYHYV